MECKDILADNRWQSLPNERAVLAHYEQTIVQSMTTVAIASLGNRLA